MCFHDFPFIRICEIMSVIFFQELLRELLNFVNEFLFLPFQISFLSAQIASQAVLMRLILSDASRT